MKITILGGGSWGTALAMHIARQQHNVKIWEFFEGQAKKMQDERHCPLLPDAKLLDNIFVTHNIEESLQGSDLILLVVPSDKVSETIDSAKHFFSNQPILICSKGLSEGLEFMTDLLSKKITNELFCLYGPTHAEEVCHGKFSGIVLAGKDNGVRLGIKDVLTSKNFKVECTEDIIGIQIASALKNIVAVFIGMLDGLNLGDNAKAYAITKGLQEIKKLGICLGGKADTFYGLAGIGDIIVTATSQHSRNRYVGEQIGKGRKLDNILNEMNMVAEGIITIKSSIQLARREKIKLPLIEGLYNVLFNEKDPIKVLEDSY